MSTISFEEFLKRKSAWYKTVKTVYCPILNESIVFNSKGFYHLRYDSHGKQRSIKEQRYKIGLLPLVIPVLQSAKSIYEYKKEEYSKPLGKYYELWELRSVVGTKNPVPVSVVLRRIGTGNITFLSVWKNKTKYPS
ncbi:MAG: hypothetical protein JST86_09605 [Bacteroidetes bacterium]|nr:hypothetical protein [Bacteroidota bacterium]